MARLLAWSPEAIEDLEAIAAYIERDSAWYARAVVSKIVETAETIPRFVHSYRIIYRLQDDRILIAAIVHGSRLLQPLLLRDQRPRS